MQTQIQLPLRPAASPRPRLLGRLDIEAVRVQAEREVAARIEAHPQFASLAAARIPSDPQEIRRRLLARSLRLTESMAPVAYRSARTALEVLGAEGAIEIYQRSGGENASIHLVQAPILLEIHGRLLPLLDEGALLGVFGHELGHYLAHGHWSSLGRAHGLSAAIGHPAVSPELARHLYALSMLAELTADRAGLLACQDLHAMLRLEMVTLTGLSGDVLTWDTDAYLAQCQELMGSVLASGDAIYGSTHPEHSLRAYALWLFSETKTYRELTGTGSGTRELDEVDALLWRFFSGDGGPAWEPGYHLLEDPPHELHECALAAAVMVGFADGELVDAEAEAIERIFGSLVSDWRSYLDEHVACERFVDGAPVLAAVGGDLLGALFNLLVHVMGADGVIDEAEVGAILAIGDALGCRDQYRQKLVSTLSTLGVDVRVEEVERAELPLPARPGETADAFDAFMRGVERRGESAITLRRLLRLLGSDRRDEVLVSRIQAALARRQIESDADLATVDLDARVQLTPRRVHVEPASTESFQGDARSGLARALTRLRDQLVSGDGRSPSVRMRALRKGRSVDLAALEKLSPGLAERVLAQARDGKAAQLVSANEAGSHKDGRSIGSELLALDREHHARLEETGAHDLYLGYPILAGNVTSSDKRTGLYLVRAPLVLHPVDLVREGQGAPGFKLRPRKDESPVVNQSLLRLVFNKKGFAYPDELADELDALAGDPAAGLEAVLAKLERVGLSIRRDPGALRPFEVRSEEIESRGAHLDIEECAALGIFPQSSSDLLQDYDGLLAELAAPGVDVAALLGAGQALLPDILRHGEPRVQEGGAARTAAAYPPVILADPSQRKVIGECRTNGVTVVDGPPGTGKSQVIVNLVTDALRRGERVAVVCEKRAALDVVTQRLEALGLRHLLGLVHDTQEDRRALYEQIASRIEEQLPRPFDAREASRITEEHERVTAALEGRSRALEHRMDGAGLTAGELGTLVAGLEEPGFAPTEGLSRLSSAQLRELHDVVLDLHPLAFVWMIGSRWRAPHGSPRHSLAGLSDAQLAAVAKQIEEALYAAREHERLAAACPVDVGIVDTVRGALIEARRSREGCHDVVEQKLFGRLLDRVVEAPHEAQAAEEARATWELASTALVRWQHPVEMSATPELLRALGVTRHWAGRFLRFFILGWWLARRSVKHALLQSWPERAGEPLDRSLLDAIADRITASGAWKRMGSAAERLRIRELLPSTAEHAGAFIARVANFASGAARLASLRGELEAVRAWLPAGDDPGRFDRWDRVLDERLTLAEVRERARQSAGCVAVGFPWIGELPRAAELEALLIDFRRDGRRLAEADALLERGLRTLPAFFALLDALAGRWREAGPDRWNAALTRAWAEAWLTRAEDEVPGLATLGGDADDREVVRMAARLGELEHEVAEIEVERVLSTADQAELLRTRAAEKHQRRTGEQKVKEAILKETGKKRRLMPLRSFVRRFAPDGLLDVIPVWLLSPETMGILFPREPLFDLVVFDEASQCTVESGFPVLLRAKRVVIAGDEKQMPPSNYFATAATPEEEDEEETTEEQREVRDLLGAESLLTLARPRVAHEGLRWHYRCRSEALIAFSNHAMYHGDLLTIPATAGPDAPSALRWVRVPDGKYDKGENRPEAEKVVDVLHELLERSPRPSVGIVTFNLRQKKAVLDAIDARRGVDRLFAELYDEACGHDSVDARPFVKNLEHVQGDERDVIVFSLGHAPVARARRGVVTGEHYVPARFGPLGQRGGERRLNVAISRAKQECWLIASFEPSQMSVAGTRNEGPKLFKEFIDFAHHLSHGRHAQAQGVLDRVRETGRSAHQRGRKLPLERHYQPLVTQIALALEREGVPFELDVGASDLRVPLAVLSPDDPTRFVLAVLTDEGSQPMSAFERHVHRPKVLDDRGWQVVHVTAASWLRRRGEILERILELVPNARGALDNEVWRRHLAARRAAPTPPPAPPALATGPAAAIVIGGAAAQGSEQVAAPAPELPPWAAHVEDPFFLKALLHLEQHKSLSELELANLVGGPRRGRIFATKLSTWAPTLPFIVEVSAVGGTKMYRNVGTR